MVSMMELIPTKDSEPVDLEAEFQWIDCSHPDNVKTAINRHIIHRHSMKDVGKARRKRPREKVKRVLLDLSALERVTERATKEALIVPSWWLGSAAGMDPFIRYPVEVDSAAQELLAAVFQDEGGLQRPLRDAWFAVALADEAAFLQVLSNSALHLDAMRNGGRRPRESSQSIYFQLRTIKSVNDRLRDNNTFVSDESIGAVAALMVHDDIIGNFDGWAKHHKGLEKMIDLHGGIESLARNEMLRITISWVELRGAAQQDIPPSFPIPYQWAEQVALPSLPYDELLQSRALSRTWAREFPGEPEWIRIYEALVLFSMDTFPIPVGSATMQESRTGAWTNPIIHRLLTFRPLIQCGTSNKSLIQEACRLGSLLYLTPVWRTFGVFPVRPETFVEKLKDLIITHEIEWPKLWKLYLWILFVGAMEAHLVGETEWFVGEIASTLQEHGVESWDEGLACIQEILWVESIFGGKNGRLCREIGGLIEQAL